MPNLAPLAQSRPIRLFAVSLLLTTGPLGLAKNLAPADSGAGDEIEDVTKLAPFEVKGARLEDFGFRTWGMLAIPGTSYVIVTEVFPNTPASKAGLRPGELILRIDGRSMWFISMMTKLPKMQELKWAELEAGKKSVAYSLEVRAPGAADSRTVTMVMPSPPPHWGSQKWTAPEGRMSAVVTEPGPLAVLSRKALDNGIWSVSKESSFLDAAPFYKDPILGYEWRIVQPSGTHRIWVTQQRGRTEILLEHRSPETGVSLFLTAPSGALDKASCLAPKKEGKRRQFSPEEIRSQFSAEIDFWLTKVGQVTGRWPFEALSGNEVQTDPTNAGSETGKMSAPLAESFLKLPVATAAQKDLFFAALAKVGLDADCWAYTESSRSPDDDHTTTVRFDPSKPPEERSTLLKVDGKGPKAAYLQQWRNEGHSAAMGMGDLPALSSIIDVNDVRVYSEETTAVVFELPVKASNSEFPADRFQARFRVNKTLRGFEDFSVKLRGSMRVAGIAKLTDAGLEARFQSFDPALAPQPVLLMMGGGIRVLFVRVSRAYEVTRVDFKRVVPFGDQVKADQQ